jgi:hypothetical protein
MPRNVSERENISLFIGTAPVRGNSPIMGIFFEAVIKLRE